MDTKICSKCKGLKCLSEYNAHKKMKDGKSSICKQCASNRNKKYYKKNKNKILTKQKTYGINHRQTKQYRENRKKYIREYQQKQRTNSSYKIQDNISRRIRASMTQGYKSETTIKLLGCSIEELKIHLEEQFKKGMSWDNYGMYGWHIDHIMPCSSFDLTDIEQQKICFHYTNLQPLWAKDNLSKGNKSSISIL